MKSNISVALITLILLIVYPTVKGIHKEDPGDMAHFIPQNALVYFEQKKGALFLEEFRRSPLGKNFERIDFIGSFEEIGLSAPLTSLLGNILNFYTEVKDNEAAHEIFGQMFSVALLPPEGRGGYGNLQDYIKENSLVVAKPAIRGWWRKFFGEKHLFKNRDYPFSSAQYGAHLIRRFTVHGQTVSLVDIEGFFIIALSEKRLRSWIDDFDNRLPDLAGKKDFITFRQNFEMSDRFFYFPINSLRKFLAKKIEPLLFTGKELLLKELKTTVGFSHFGYGSWSNELTVVDKIMVQYNKHIVNNIVKAHMDIAPAYCTTLPLTSDNPMAFYWSNTVKVKHLLNYIATTRNDNFYIDNFLSVVETVSGKSAEDFFSLFGEELSLIVEPGTKDDFFSIPQSMFFLQVNSVPELNNVFEKVIEKYKIRSTDYFYGPIRYTYWTPSPQDGMKPLYGFWGDYLFFGNSSKLLHSIIKRNYEDLSLLDNGSVKAIDPGFLEKNNTITYMDNVSLIKLLQKCLNFIGMIVSIEDREAAGRLRGLIDEIVNPLLEGAMMYDKSTTRSYFTDKFVVIDSITHKVVE